MLFHISLLRYIQPKLQKKTRDRAGISMSEFNGILLVQVMLESRCVSSLFHPISPRELILNKLGFTSKLYVNMT